MAGQWDALVLDDYEAVMPLTWKKKWSIRYLYQPPFTQQLGIFSRSLSPEVLLPGFISAMKDHFRFAEIFLNYGHTGNDLELKTNFILSLKASYDTICGGFSRDAIKNIRRSEKFQLHYTIMDDLGEAISIYKIMCRSSHSSL